MGRDDEDMVVVDAIDGEFLSWCRRSSGRTVKEVAEALGISEHYLRNIERGHRLGRNRVDVVKKASEIFDVSPGKLTRQR